MSGRSARGLEHLEAVHVRHLVVDDDEVERLPPDEVDRVVAAARPLHRVAERPQHVRAEHDHLAGVVDDEHSGPAGGHRPRSGGQTGRATSDHGGELQLKAYHG
jgi:hypothetical protein